MITLRVNTAIVDQSAIIISCTIEVPEGRHGWKNHLVDHETGVVEGWQVPRWDEVRQLIYKAHLSLPDLPAIAWDLAITPAGPVIIEANSHWDFRPIQQVLKTPALATPIADAYRARL